MNILVSNNPMDVIVDNFCKYAVIIPQVLEQLLFEVCRNSDYIVLIWFNKPPWRSYEYALLDNDAVPVDFEDARSCFLSHLSFEG